MLESMPCPILMQICMCIHVAAAKGGARDGCLHEGGPPAARFVLSASLPLPLHALLQDLSQARWHCSLMYYMILHTRGGERHIC